MVIVNGAAAPAATALRELGSPEYVQDVIRLIAEQARKVLPIDRVILFGSRARGDFRANSDIDLAFDHRGTEQAWADFINELHDSARTLLELDLVDLRSAPLALRSKILAEGRVVA